MGFFSKNTGVGSHSPGALPNPGIKPASPASPALQAGSLPLSHLRGPSNCLLMPPKLSVSLCVYVCVFVTQSCLTLCNPMDCSPPGSSVHGILLARILEWVAVPFSSRFSHPGIKPGSPALQADSLPSELPRKVHPTDKEMEAERSEIRCPR